MPIYDGKQYIASVINNVKIKIYTTQEINKIKAPPHNTIQQKTKQKEKQYLLTNTRQEVHIDIRNVNYVMVVFFEPRRVRPLHTSSKDNIEQLNKRKAGRQAGRQFRVNTRTVKSK